MRKDDLEKAASIIRSAIVRMTAVEAAKLNLHSAVYFIERKISCAA